MAYKTFANGFPLPASDLNNYLMNQSVIVFANSTARSAALPTPTEGMVTYLEDTNLIEVYNGSAWADINDNTAAIPKSTVTTAGDLIVADGTSSVTRLGVGAVDQVLTSDGTNPIWADAGGGAGDWSQIVSSVSITGANTYQVTGLSGYSDYMVQYADVSAAANNVNFNVSKINNSSLNNYGVFVRTFLPGSTGSTSSNVQSYLQLGRNSSSGLDADFFIYFEGANSTSPARVTWLGGCNSTSESDYSFIGQGIATKNSQALNSITIQAEGSTFDSGNISVWAR